MKACGFDIGLDHPFFLIAGPCVIESRELAFETAGRLKEITGKLGVPFIYKSSFDKANRSSGKVVSRAGHRRRPEDPGRCAGPAGCAGPHRRARYRAGRARGRGGRHAADAGLPVPADRFHPRLCGHAQAGEYQKGQFLAPHDMLQVARKARDAALEAGGDGNNILVCERGASFGYNNLVSDMRSLAIMRETDCPVVFDATHSVQLPGGQGTSSGGQREFVPVLARAAVAVGVAGLFMETHPNPACAMSDGPNAVPLDRMAELLESLVALDRVTKRSGFLENQFV